MATTLEQGPALQWPEESRLSRTQIGMTLGAVAAGIVIGLVSSMGRKIAVQSAATRNRDWDEVLQLEHRAVEALLNELLATEGSETGKRTALLAKIKQALLKHAIEEENAIYPALKRIDAQEEGDGLFEEHAEIKKALYDLDRMEKADATFLPRVRDLADLISRHVQEEESNLYPRLKRSMTAEECTQATSRIWKEGLKLA